MKEITVQPAFLNDHRAWLEQLDNIELLFGMLEIFDHECFYIDDENHQILHWSQGVEQLTGRSSESVLGSICPPEYYLPDEEGIRSHLIKLDKPDGNLIEVEKITKALFNKTGNFYGGIGLLFSPKESIGSVVNLDSSNSSKENFHGILSRSPAMQAVFQIIQNAAETEATVLVRGESGAGKELVAKAIHILSNRHNAPFLAINCAALSSNLLESELFGHVRGAFTGAIKDHKGLFQRANGGTLFLDEVAELPLDLQAKLLRVIQERNFIPVGGDRSMHIDVRIVAATHRSIREEVAKGRFREDLMYRLRVVPIFLPPLRERREDISLLLWHFIERHNQERGRKIEKIDPDAMRLLLDYRWPGNVRELHNVVQYAFAVGRGTTLRLSELPPEFRESLVFDVIRHPRKQNPVLKPEDEASVIHKALEQANGRSGMAANLLGMSRATFWRKRKLHGI